MQPLGAQNQTASMNDLKTMLKPPAHHSHSHLSHNPPAPFHASGLSGEFLKAAEYRKRDSGSMALFLDSKINEEYVSPRVPSRAAVPGTARAAFGADGRLIDGSVTGPITYTPRQPRLVEPEITD